MLKLYTRVKEYGGESTGLENNDVGEQDTQVQQTKSLPTPKGGRGRGGQARLVTCWNVC